MNPDEIKRLIEQIYREKEIEKESVFRAIEEALLTAASRHGNGPEHSNYEISIDRQTCEIYVSRDNVPITTAEITERAGAQSVRQSITQKIREAVRDKIYDKYTDRVGELVLATVHKVERMGVLVYIDDNQEAWLPNANKIRGEVYRSDSKYDMIIESVEKVGARARVILSRKSKLLVRRLFERECPEISNGSVEIVEISRDPGSRSKVAVRAVDSRLDPVGACLGPRNTRYFSVSNALNREKIDIVIWSESTSEFIQNALSPAKVDEVILCAKLDRAIVLVQPDQRALAIGKRGQNVNLAKKLLGGWELEILTHSNEDGSDELVKLLDKASENFKKIDGMTHEYAEALVSEGFTSFYDLSCIEPGEFAEMTGATMEETAAILERAEELALLEEEEREKERQQVAQIREQRVRDDRREFRRGGDR